MTEDLRTKWRSIKEHLQFSTIKCYRCNEYLYYGQNTRVTRGNKQPKFTCRCSTKIVVNDKCALCNKSVLYELVHIPATWMRCTCGHAEIVAQDQIATTIRV